MPDLQHLIANNRRWAAQVHADDPTFFATLAQQQSPKYLWIGCADSRVPANSIVNLRPGELFVHRNVANVVVHTDLNCLSCLQFGVDVLRVEHIIVVGHYGCGGVAAALHQRRIGLVDNWLRHIQDIRLKHAAHIDALPDEARADRLCELNVIEQVVNVAQTTVVHEAWERGQTLTIHGWTYSLQDGLVRDLGITIPGQNEVTPTYQRAVAALG
ncbi:MAG: carbonate dehydratase [Verrucomicrobia bacterium]|nr:MAG: carbonate dehydratase [Verrucomicrobiota bacterium]